MRINRQLCISTLLFFPCVIFSYTCYAIDSSKNLETRLNIFLESYRVELADNNYRSEFTTGKIDPRLAKQDCSKDLKFSFNRKPLEQNNVTVLVECNDAKPWKLYVAVEYNIYGRVITAAETISRGTLISANMLQHQEEIVNRGRYISYSSTEDIIGMVAKRTIRNNALITPGQLSAPNLVKRGDNVLIIAANDSISVKMNGTALTDGVLGDQISIRNNQSKRVIKGRVIKTGQVLVAL